VSAYRRPKEGRSTGREGGRRREGERKGKRREGEGSGYAGPM